jgi:hypothetical protein
MAYLSDPKEGFMKKLVFASAVGLMFASCGLIPPIPVDDMLAMDNVETAAINLAGKNSLTAQAATGTLVTDITFNDLSAISSLPVSPSSISIRLGARGVVVTGCAAAAATTDFTVTNIEATLRNQGSATGTIISFNDVTFTGTLASGVYTASNISGGTVKSLVISDVIDILKNPGNGKNTVTFSMNLSATSDTLKGCSVKFRWGKAAGEVKF